VSRPNKGIEHVESVEGSTAAKERLRMVLETLAGGRSVESACAKLGVSPARFAQIREEALAAAVAALEPRPVGRPPTPGPDPEVDRLRGEVKELRRDLEASRIREEIAIVMPHVLLPPEGSEQKGGGGAKRGGRSGT
jgi:transposase-like protein